MAQSEEHIKRLIRELDLPEQADQVVLRPKYWTPAFCWRYFERCDELIFDDAHAGLQAAEVAPELVDLVSRFHRDAEPRSALRLRALAIVGSAYRAVGDLQESERFYRGAVGLARDGAVSDSDRANLLFRIARLRSVQNRHDEALSLATESVATYRKADDRIRQAHLGEALTLRGLFHQMAGQSALAVRDWSEALCCTDPRRSLRIHLAASHNLICSLVERGVDSRSLSRVESYLRQARKFLSKRPRSVHKLRLVWLQGMIMVRFGSTRRGEAALYSARQGLIEMGAPFDMAMISLELGRYLYQSRQLSKLSDLAIETGQLFRAHCSDQQANRALVIWRQAVLAEKISLQIFTTAWEAMQQRATAMRKA